MPRRGKVLIPGTVIGGVLVLEELGGDTMLHTRYRIRYQCCLTGAVMAHPTLMDRARKGLTSCPACAASQDRYEASREKITKAAEAIGLKVLKVIKGSRVRETRFLIVSPCCGKQQDLGITAMRLRVKTQFSKCRTCNATDQLGKAKAGRKKEDQSDPREITAGPLWPKPPSVPIGQWCWGAR